MAEILRGIQEEKRNNHVEGNSKKLGIAIRKSVLMKTAQSWKSLLTTGLQPEITCSARTLRSDIEHAVNFFNLDEDN